MRLHFGSLWTIAPILLACPASLSAQPVSQQLPTGQAITPEAAPGARFSPLVTHAGPYPDYIADGAAAIATSPGGSVQGREMLVLTSGFNRFVGANGKVVPAQAMQYVLRYRIDARGSRLVQSLTVPNSFGGIAWQPDGRGFIVGGGVDDTVHVFARQGAMFAETGTIALGHAAGLGANVKPQAAGVAVSPDGARALVTNYYNDSVSLLDLATRRVIAEQDLRPGKIDPRETGVPGGEFPFAVVWTDAAHAWVSAPRDRQLIALNVTATSVRVARRIATLGEPTALLLDTRRQRLFATEDNADRIAVVDLASARLTAELRIAVPGLDRPGKGLNPNGLAQLPNGSLLVTLGGINALAVMTPDAGAVQGLIPTGWYPSAVGLSTAAGRQPPRVFVVNRKSPPGPNPLGCVPSVAFYRGQPDACGKDNQYIYQLEKSGLLQFPLPGPRALIQTTLQVASNIGLPGAPERAAADVAMAAIRARIRHVVFIIKENRTYDQVLGDLEVGNGDPRLAILGRAVSPNHHQLARQFVTLDNFYDSGEQSSTGWTWSTAARVPDLLEKTAPVNYASRGLGYEAEEADRFVYAQQTLAERQETNPKLSTDPDLLAGPALLTAPDAADDDDKPGAGSGQGFLWDAAIRAGLSVRNYGFSDASVYDPGAPGAVPLIREPAKEGHRIYTPGDRLLAPRSDPYFRGFDQNMPDFWREREWQREYDQQDGTGILPALTLLRLSHDHFGDFGTAIDGVNTVETEMADNDYALGSVIDHIAHSRAAGSTLIVAIEDDAQNGADHVDARRSVAFFAGAAVRQGAVVSGRYTTVNVLRTIEAVLGLPPLGLNDALAMPMVDVFDPRQAGWTYRAVAADVLRQTQLPIPADRFAAPISAMAGCVGRDAQWWASAMRGQDFRDRRPPRYRRLQCGAVARVGHRRTAGRTERRRSAQQSRGHADPRCRWSEMSRRLRGAQCRRRSPHGQYSAQICGHRLESRRAFDDRSAVLNRLSRPAAVLFALVLLAMSIWCLTAKPPPIRVAKKGGYTDVHLYHDIATANAKGVPYHQAAAAAQRAHHYPLKPFFTMRLPTLNWLAVHFGWRGVQKIAFCGLFAAILAWVTATEDTLHGFERIGIGIALAAGGGSIVDPAILALHEYLAGIVLALALAGVFGWPHRWWLILLPAAAALAIRELALPFALLAASFAVYDRRWREVAGWTALLLAFVAAMMLHADAVAPQLRPGDIVSQGWTAGQGFSAFLKAVIFTSVLQGLPLGLALLAAMLPLVGWLALPGRSGLFAVLLFAGYAVMISLFSRADTFYWGAIVMPAYFIGFALLPRAFWQLSQAIREAPPGAPALTV